jgi:hypothetical protein
VLARHNRIVRAVYGQPRDIPGGEFGRHALDLEVRIDRHAAKPVARNRKARRQRIGLHAGAPNHGGCRDSLACRKGRALRVDGDHGNAGACLDTKAFESRGDHRPRVPHVGSDQCLTVGENQAWRCSGAGSWRLCDGGAQFAEHLGRDLDARETTAHDQDVILTGGFRADRQCADMIVEQRAGFECVDIEGNRSQDRQ